MEPFDPMEKLAKDSGNFESATPLISVSTTDRIAFKIETSMIADLFNVKNKYKEDVTIDGKIERRVKPNIHLIGLQFLFKEVDDSTNILTYLDHIEICQVYFDNTSGGEKFFLEREDIDQDKVKLKKRDSIFFIKEFKKDDPRWSGTGKGGQLGDVHHEMNENSFPNSTTPDDKFIFKSLDFFNEETGFIYFSIDQLKSICELFTDIIISGCELNLGKKLVHRQEDLSKAYSSSYFTLKIEGKNSKFVKPSLGGSHLRDSETIETDGAGVTIGHPCPPDWFTINKITGQVINLIDPSSGLSIVPTHNSFLWEIRNFWFRDIYNPLIDISLPNNNDQM